MKLTPGEKLISFMLADLIEHFDIKRDIDPKFVKDVISGGHTWALKWEYDSLFYDEGPTDKIVDETSSIMSMCRVLENSIGNLPDVERATIPQRDQTVFVGFDGNEEPHYGVAETLVKKLGRFDEWHDRSLNSHSRSIDRYRRMKAVYDDCPTDAHGYYDLVQIKKIIGA